jgi:hypothetical protein
VNFTLQKNNLKIKKCLMLFEELFVKNVAVPLLHEFISSHNASLLLASITVGSE